MRLGSELYHIFIGRFTTLGQRHEIRIEVNGSVRTVGMCVRRSRNGLAMASNEPAMIQQ